MTSKTKTPYIINVDTAEESSFTVRAQLDDGDGNLITSATGIDAKLYNLNADEPGEVVDQDSSLSAVITTAQPWSVDDIGYTFEWRVDMRDDITAFPDAAPTSGKWLISVQIRTDQYAPATEEDRIYLHIYINVHENWH